MNFECPYYSERDVRREWVNNVNDVDTRIILEYTQGICSKLSRDVACLGLLAKCERRVKQNGLKNSLSFGVENNNTGTIRC
jgi:hypothetical protein